jgi:hypothetical protein
VVNSVGATAAKQLVHASQLMAVGTFEVQRQPLDEGMVTADGDLARRLRHGHG